MLRIFQAQGNQIFWVQLNSSTLDSAIIFTPMDCKGGWIQGARRVAKGVNNYRKRCPSSAKSNQPRLNTQQQGRAQRCGASPPLTRASVVVCRALADYSMVNRKIAYPLGRGRLIFLAYLQQVGKWVRNMFRKSVLDFLTCPPSKPIAFTKGMKFCCRTGLHRGGYSCGINLCSDHS